MNYSDYPVSSIIPELIETLAENRLAVLEAPPGAGKSTILPPLLTKETWSQGKVIYLLQPRRSAARSVAHRIREIAPTLKVGLLTRTDKSMPASPAIIVMTEGVYLNRLIANPEQTQTAMVIFDEFHEQSINTHTALALTLNCMDLVNEDLKILIMSATLDIEPLKTILDKGSTFLKSDGKMYPVSLEYKPFLQDRNRHSTSGFSISDHSAAVCLNEAPSEAGSILIFLPGEAEINRCRQVLSADKRIPEDMDIFPLYGRLSSAEQQKAIRPPAKGRRKIVIATNTAETSITIEGITLVIDSGLKKQMIYHTASGLSRLEITGISQASASQRAGRAGRTGPGRCIRLWDSRERLMETDVPEILRTDLSVLILSLAAWGDSDPTSYRWPFQPEENRIKEGKALLERLGALDSGGNITPEGRRIHRMPLHPRLASMVRDKTTALLAALLENGDPFLQERSVSGGPFIDPKLVQLKEAWHSLDTAGTLPFYLKEKLKYSLTLQIIQDARRIEKLINAPSVPDGLRMPALLSAYPERLGRLLEEDIYQLVNGKQMRLNGPAGTALPKWIAAADCRDAPPGSKYGYGKIFLCDVLDEKEVDAYLKVKQITEFEILIEKNHELKARKISGLGRLIINEQPVALSSIPDAVGRLLEAVKKEGEKALPWTKESAAFRDRLSFIFRSQGVPWPDVSDEALLSSIGNWLPGFTGRNITRRSLAELPMKKVLRSLIPWEAGDPDKVAPESFMLPSGTSRRIQYYPDKCLLSARIQQLFGLESTPLICGKPLEIELLSPAGRPQQITSDLTSFWKSTYPEVKKELKGRYPKHYWPEDPAAASATDRVRPVK
ncbi:MAG: ATP-dependent helicase HrpB [Spirochaetales bacterium]|nr:ATP-dependent helicase HrpB [Spirochaetales bacterium]